MQMRNGASKLRGETMTTECEKIVAVQDRSMAISEFLEWLDTQGICLCVVPKTKTYYPGEGYDRFEPISGGREQLLADFFGIDLKKVEEERREILKQLRVKP